MPRPQPISRDLAELLFGYGFIVTILWLPEHAQIILSPVALIATLAIVLLRRPTLDDLGLGPRGFLRSSWILLAAIALTIAGVSIARKLGTFHPLYDANFSHVAGYVTWTLYQQFLLQDYFMPRLVRLVPTEASAVGVAAVLFATAHLPNLALIAATVVWGAISCALFLRYRNLYMLGLAQGLLGLCFAVCIPDALHHHMRVGLGYLRYSLATAPQ
jgi:hypothetical protein